MAMRQATRRARKRCANVSAKKLLFG